MSTNVYLTLSEFYYQHIERYSIFSPTNFLTLPEVPNIKMRVEWYCLTVDHIPWKSPYRSIFFSFLSLIIL